MKLLIFLSLMICFKVQARVVVLTSFSKLSEQTKTEKLFKKHFPKAQLSEVEMIHQADQWAVYQTLLDPSVTALFWFSHGVSGPQSIPSQGGAGILPKLLDFRGDNVAPVFSFIQPSLKFISIVGCDSSRILEENDVQLTSIATYIPIKKRVALHLQVRRAIKAYNTKPEFSASLSESLPTLGEIEISRLVEENTETRSLRVYAGRKLIGLIPATSGRFTLSVPQNSDSLKIKIESGQNAAALQAPIGELEVFSSNIEGSWKLFANSQGVPFGVNHRVFIHRR